VTSYKKVLVSCKPKRRFQAGTEQRWAYTVQWLLDKKCKGDALLLVGVINTALHHPDYTNAAQRGPEQIRKRWRALLTEYTMQQSKEAKQNG
jgi:hypothetical protein